MKRTLALVALFVAAAIVLVARGCESGAEPERAADEVAHATTDGGAHTLARAEALTSRASIDPEVFVSADDLAASGLADVATSNGAAPLTRVRGVIVRHDGSPAVDASVLVHGWRAFGAPKQSRSSATPTWNDVAAVTNADGSFTIEFPWHPHWKYQLTAAARMAPRVVWTIPDLVPGGELDMGTIVLPLGGEVVVHIVRPDGTPVQGPWRAEARDAWPTRWRADRSELVEWEPLEGGCGLRSTSVAAGLLEVRVRSPLREWAHLDGEVLVVPGEVTHLTLVYDGEPLERRLVLAFERGLVDWFGPPDVANVRLRGIAALPELETHPLRLVWSDVPPGDHELSVNDARFEPLSNVRVSTGRTNSVALVGSVELTFDVRSSTGHALRELAFESINVTWPSDRYADPVRPEMLSETESSASAGVCVRTVPDPQIWIVTAAEHAPHVLEFAAGFAPGARERIDVRLEPRATIAGHVVDSLGAPVVGCELQATRVDASGRALPDAPRERFLDQHLQYMAHFDAERAVTDERGAFRFGHLDAAALYDIATEGRAPSGEVRGVAVGSSDVRLELSAAGRLVGRLLPAFASLDEYEIQLAERAQDVAPGRAQRDPWLYPRRQRFALDGSFAFDELPIGRLEFRIVHVGKDGGGALHTRSGTELLRDSVWIEEGATTNLDLDIAHLTPATAHIHIRETTHTAIELVVCVERWDEGAQQWRRHMRSPVGADGVAHVTPLARGRWRFLYQALDALWTAPLPGEYELSDGGSIDLTFDVALVYGTVMLVDTEGQALSGLELYFDGAWCDSTTLTTAKGELALVLPLGRMRIGTGSDVDPATEESRLTPAFEVEWTATGPLPRVVTVPDEH